MSSSLMLLNDLFFPSSFTAFELKAIPWVLGGAFIVFRIAGFIAYCAMLSMWVLYALPAVFHLSCIISDWNRELIPDKGFWCWSFSGRVFLYMEGSFGDETVFFLNFEPAPSPVRVYRCPMTWVGRVYNLLLLTLMYIASFHLNEIMEYPLQEKKGCWCLTVLHWIMIWHWMR